MKTCLSLIAALVLAAGCKTDNGDSTAGSPAPEVEQSARKGRSGKIDLPTQRQRDPETGDTPRPGLRADDESREDRRARREERRAERMAELDTDKDGTISDAERQAAQKQRMDEMKTRLDTDGDGKLTVQELQASRMSRRLGDVTALDTDKNGEISADEMQKGMDDMRAQGWGGRRGGRGWGNDAPTTPAEPTKTP
jgi:hypothetical protein